VANAAAFLGLLFVNFAPRLCSELGELPVVRRALRCGGGTWERARSTDWRQKSQQKEVG